MRPRTKRQAEIMKLHAKLCECKPQWEQWMRREGFYHYAIHKAANSKHYSCSECGGEFEESPLAMQALKCKCPHCGTPIEKEIIMRKPTYQESYFCISQAVGEYQVLRVFHIERFVEFGHPAKHYNRWNTLLQPIEVLQRWCYINPKGQEDFITVARKKRMGGFYNHTLGYDYMSDMEIRPNAISQHGYYGYSSADIEINCAGRVISCVKRMQYGRRFLKSGKFDMYEAYKRACDTQYQTMGEMGFAKWANRMQRYDISHRWQSIKIAMRHGYMPKDAKLWLDYVTMLENEFKDIRNPHYICPQDLKKAHDDMVKAIQRRRAKADRDREKAEMQRLIKQTSAFNKLRAPYLGIVITGKNCIIKPLQSPLEYREEGQAMHHCVGTANYVMKERSICLTARDAQGNRLATIEFDLKTLQVLQCRAEHNNTPERYAELVQLMEDNKHLFINAQKKAKAKAV